MRPGSEGIPATASLYITRETTSMSTKPRNPHSVRTESKIKPPDQRLALAREGSSVDSKIKPPDGPRSSARKHPSHS